MCSNRGSLNLLLTYQNDDSSEEDVPACIVSTKRCLRDPDEDNSNKKLKTKLPPPVFSTKAIQLDVESDDDPSLHDGRIRSFPHERGNWATYVYIPYEPNSFILELSEKIISLLPHLNLKVVDNFHISLTKTVILRHHWIDLFVKSIKQDISQFFKKFVIVFGDFEVYCNEEGTRTFLGLEVLSGFDTIHNIVQKLDKCLEDFKLEPFYKFPSFHMSVVWCSGNQVNEIKNSLQQINSVYDNFRSLNCDTKYYFVVDNINCKSGNKLFQFPLM